MKFERPDKKPLVFIAHAVQFDPLPTGRGEGRRERGCSLLQAMVMTSHRQTEIHPLVLVNKAQEEWLSQECIAMNPHSVMVSPLLDKIRLITLGLFLFKEWHNWIENWLKNAHGWAITQGLKGRMQLMPPGSKAKLYEWAYASVLCVWRMFIHPCPYEFALVYGHQPVIWRWDISM